MREHIINSFQDLITLFEKFNDNSSFIFRGQSDADWNLLPKAGRNESIRKAKYGLSDKRLFRSWKRYATNYVSTQLSNDWEWYSMAQHHGLATRLLDWTKNPMVAAFFAVNENIEKDAAIFTFRIDQTIDVTDYESPFDVQEFSVYYPSGVSTRIIIQRGLFSISNNPNDSIETILKNKLNKIIIPAKLRAEVKKQLDFYDVNIFSIFQNLDRLSEYLNNYSVGTIDRSDVNPPMG